MLLFLACKYVAMKSGYSFLKQKLFMTFKLYQFGKTSADNCQILYLEFHRTVVRCLKCLYYPLKDNDRISYFEEIFCYKIVWTNLQALGKFLVNDIKNAKKSSTSLFKIERMKSKTCFILASIFLYGNNLKLLREKQLQLTFMWGSVFS